MAFIRIQQKEIEERIATVDKSLEEIDDFIKDCEENEIPKSILKCMWRGEYHLTDERYYLSSELFELSQKIAAILMEMIEIDKEARTCCKKPESDSNSDSNSDS